MSEVEVCGFVVELEFLRLQPWWGGTNGCFQDETARARAGCVIILRFEVWQPSVTGIPLRLTIKAELHKFFALRIKKP